MTGDKYSFLADILHQRDQQGNKRILPSLTGLIDFSSNDYLGLARSKELFDQINTAYGHRQHHQNGGTGSRLLSGNHELYAELESYLENQFNVDACMVFNSGYVANQGLISAVAGKGDTIIYDQLAHICIKEGAWLSKAETFSYVHNSVEDLERRLSSARGRIFVVTESVFSMDGDIAPIQSILELCEQYHANLIVDEAHATGCYGDCGAGWLAEAGLQDRVFATVLTFGKGMGVHGACVLGPAILRDFLVNFGRSFIYTTSLPPHSVLSILEAFKYLSANSSIQVQLHERIAFFKQRLKEITGIETNSETAIQPILIVGNERCKMVASKLQTVGYDIRPILSPTVQAGKERLRISLHVHNTHEEIEAMIKELSQHLV